MKLTKPVAVIDKSLFQAICAVPEPALRENLWDELLHRYQLAIPFVLIEEVWINYGKPDSTEYDLVNEMVRVLRQMVASWMDDEIEIVFRELVQSKQIKKFLPPSKEVIEFSLGLKPGDPKFAQWLDENWRAKKRVIEERIAEQRLVLPEGTFAPVSSEGDLFHRYVRVKFMEILESPDCTNKLLENSFGRKFRHRHPNFKKRIQKAFSCFNKETFKKYPVTLSYIMASMFYFYAPLCRIESADGTSTRKIIGSKRNEQRNNLSDQQYVVSALLCDRLLTCDEGMSNIMKVFKQPGFWTGETIFIDIHKSLNSQIPRLLT